MTWGDTTVLAALPFVIAVAVIVLRGLRAESSDPATRNVARRWVDRHGLTSSSHTLRGPARGALFALGVVLVVVALARPQWGETEQQTFEPAREVLLALDLSRSMDADDVAPSRLVRAKLLIETLLDSLRGERVGLVVFAGTSFLQSPLSADTEVLRDILDGLDTSYLPQGGTHYEGMLRASLDAFSQEDEADRFLVVLSDGEAHDEGFRGWLPALRKRGVRALSLGIGTVGGAILSDGAGGVIKDERGAAVLSKLEPATLRALAEETDGVYLDAAVWVDIASLIEETVARGRRGVFTEDRQVFRQERFQWLLAPALLLLMLSAWLELPVTPTARTLQRAAGRRREVFGALALVATAWIAGGPAQAAATGSTEPVPNPLTETVAAMLDKPRIEAGDYADLARRTLEIATPPSAIDAAIRNGVIDDALAAVRAGERIDADAADWNELRRLLESLPRTDPQQQAQQQQPDKGESQGEESRDESGQRQPSSAGEEDPGENADASGKGDEAPTQPSELPKTDEISDAAMGPLSEDVEPPAEGGSDTPSGGPGEKAEPPTRLVGGGSAAPDSGEHPELADALGRLQQVRDDDAPAVLFQRMNGEQQRGERGKNW